MESKRYSNYSGDLAGKCTSVTIRQLKSEIHQPYAANGLWGLWACLVMSVTFVWVTFSPDFIGGTSSYWQTEVDDITQYVAGFNAYFRSPWQWPLLAFDSLNFPIGTRVTFVDAIPLYALLLKILVPQSLAPFNPLGLWVLLCFALQGIAAWWIARALNIASWTFMLALMALLLSFPALMARLGHISLMSHWIVLFALALYWRGDGRNTVPVTGWTALLVSAFYVNIYLFVMASGIYCAAWFNARPRLTIRHLVQFLTPCVVLILTTLVTLLPLPASEVTAEWGFGYYSMNLLSPWVGGALVDFHVKEGPGQYEGFNYLGAGVIFALMVAVALSIARKLMVQLQGLRKHWALILLFLGYWFYALSNQIYWADQLIAVIAYPSFMNGVTSQFRASGRFFWPVAYGLVIWALWVWYQNFPRRIFVVLTLLMVALQLADLTGIYQELRTRQGRPAHAILDTKQWDAALEKTPETIYFYPKFKCGKDPHGTLLPMMKYAAERQIRLNTGYVARYTPDCKDTAQEIAGSETTQSAYVFAKTEFPDINVINILIPHTDRITCQTVQFAHVCRIQQMKGSQ